MKIRLLSTLLILLLTFTVFTLSACQKPEDEDPKSTEEETEESEVPPVELAGEAELNYVIYADGTSCAVLGLNLSQGAKRIEIPSHYMGIKVVGIESGAFASNIHLESIVIPDTVTHIGDNAFDGCVKLKNVEMSSSIEFIGKDAFLSCDSLSLTEHDKALYLGSEKSPYTVLYKAVDDEIDGTCTIPDGTKIIYESAFAGCADIDRIIIPNSITQIGDNAFYFCLELEFTSHNSVEYLGNQDNPYLVAADVKSRSSSTLYMIHEDTKLIAPRLFQDCSALMSVTIPKNVSWIGAYAFDSCNNLLSITFKSVDSWRMIDGEDISTVRTISSSAPDKFVSNIKSTNTDQTFVKQ